MNPIIKNGVTSWKTSVAGILAAIMLVMPGVQKNLEDGTPVSWMAIIGAVAMAVGGILARDADKSSEQSAVKKSDLPVLPPDAGK